MTSPRSGIHPQLERAANEMLRQSMAHLTAQKDKSDILTPWKEQDRYRREVYVESGTPDPSTRRGTFHKTSNPERPELNSREGHSPARSEGLDRLRAFVDGHQGDED